MIEVDLISFKASTKNIIIIIAEVKKAMGNLHMTGHKGYGHIYLSYTSRA